MCAQATRAARTAKRASDSALGAAAIVRASMGELPGGWHGHSPHGRVGGFGGEASGGISGGKEGAGEASGTYFIFKDFQ